MRRYAEYIEQKGCLYRHYRSNVYNELVPKLFVLYVPNCTVSKLHFGEPIFPLTSFLFLFRWTTTGGILGRRKNKKKREENKRQHTERMSSLFNENNEYPHYLFKVMHLLGNVIFMLKKTWCFNSLDFQLHFHDRKGIWVAFTKKQKNKKKNCLICQWRLQWNHRYAFYFNCVQV